MKQIGWISTYNPTSSYNSLFNASSTDSFWFTFPPGNVHLPLYGLCSLYINNIFESFNINPEVAKR